MEKQSIKSGKLIIENKIITRSLRYFETEEEILKETLNPKIVHEDDEKIVYFVGGNTCVTIKKDK